VSLDFLSPSPDAVSRSPMEREALAAGAVLEQRDGWNVPVRFEGAQDHTATVAFADQSHLGKLEVHGAHGIELGSAHPAHAAEPRASGLAEQRDGAWWCPYTTERALVLCEPSQTAGLRERFGADAIDLTSAYGALAISGPLARELFARFTALDLREGATPVHAFRPGSVARTPGAVLRESEDRWLMLFGAAVGSYVWTVVADAAEALGGGPVGA
jgi:glycine cleavage system aminomethyltransferase T